MSTWKPPRRNRYTSCAALTQKTACQHLSAREISSPLAPSRNELRISNSTAASTMGAAPNSRNCLAELGRVPASSTVKRTETAPTQSQAPTATKCDGLQAILCAEYLSRLAERNQTKLTLHAPMPTSPPSLQLQSTDNVQHIYDDPAVHTLVRRINCLADRLGLTSTLVLGHVINQAKRLGIAGSDDNEEGRDEKDASLTRVLYDLTVRSPCVANDQPRSDDTTFTSPSTKRERDAAMEEKERIRQEKVKKWIAKKKGRDFSSRIRYPARQQLANARKRRKGQFVSNRDSNDTS